MDIINKQFTNNKILTTLLLASSLLLSACGEPTAPPKAPLIQYTQQGNTYLKQSQFKAAMAASKSAILAYPEAIDGYLILAKIYLKFSQPETSAKVLKQYKNDKNAEYYFLLLESYQKDNKFISANHLLNTNKAILQKQPNRLKKARADILLGEKNIEQALILFKELEQVEKFKTDALIGQAHLFALSKDTSNALLLLEEVIQIDSDNSEALILKSELLINQNDLVEAEKTLSHTLTILPSSDLFTPERINILQALIEVLTSQGRSSEALLYSRILADEFPEASAINLNYLEATKQYQNKEFGLAKETLEKILNVAPGHKKSLSLYGVILFSQGDLKGAQKYLNGQVDAEKSPEKLTQLYAITQLKLDNATEVLTMLENTIITEDNYETLVLYLLAAIDQQQLDKAKFALNRIEKLFPDSDKSILLSANYYSQINPQDHEKALSTLQHGLKSNPMSPLLQTAYIKKLLFLKKDAQADKYVQQLQTSENGNIQTRLLIAEYKLFRQQYQLAEKLFNDILQQQESNLTALFRVAQIKREQQDWPAALIAYRNIILFHPQEIRGYQGVLSAQVADKQDIEQTKDRLPENYIPAILALVLADAQLQLSNIQQAKSHIDVASKGVTSDLQPYVNRLQLQISYQEAIYALKEEKFSKARQITLSALNNAPEQPALLLLLTKIEIESGQLNEARNVLHQVETILPKNQVIAVYKTEIAIAGKHPDAAIEILKDKWKKNPDDNVAQKLYTLLQQTGKPQADTFLTQWQEQLPESPTAMLNQALKSQKEGNTTEALAIYESVLKQHPNHLISLNNAAWLYTTVDDKRAEVLAHRAFSISKNNAAVTDTYGWILHKSGKTAEAKKLIKQAHELAPDNADIKKHWFAIKDL